jgi:hypothetical protein
MISTAINGSPFVNFTTSGHNMKFFATLLTTASLAFALTSCEGYRCGTGRVVDSATNRALGNVFCEAITGRQTMFTDSSGKFSLCNTMSGCVPKCKDITIRFSRPGYKTLEVGNPPASAVIYLEK